MNTIAQADGNPCGTILTADRFERVGTLEAFQVTKEMALSVLRDKAILPFGLQHSRSSWHPERGEVYEFTVRLPHSDTDRAWVWWGDWIVRDERARVSVYSDEAFRAAFRRVA